jgi:hypothetical protein
MGQVGVDTCALGGFDFDPFVNHAFLGGNTWKNKETHIRTIFSMLMICLFVKRFLKGLWNCHLEDFFEATVSLFAKHLGDLGEATVDLGSSKPGEIYWIYLSIHAGVPILKGYF